MDLHLINCVNTHNLKMFFFFFWYICVVVLDNQSDEDEFRQTAQTQNIRHLPNIFSV